MQENNFTLIRLLLASTVVFVHCIAQFPASLHSLPVAFSYSGPACVCSFFLISGYLVSQSFVQSASVGQFLLKRFVRIFPGFLIASLISVYVFAPLAGIPQSPLALEHDVMNAITLQPPESGIDTPMWTICYEAKCYLLLAIFGRMFCFKRIFALVAFFSLFLFYDLLTVINRLDIIDEIFSESPFEWVLSVPRYFFQLVPFFLGGSAFFLYKNRIEFNGITAIIALFVVVVLFPVSCLTYLVLSSFGGYLLFYGATQMKLPVALRLRTDISYGLYLYGWPVACVIHHDMPWFGPLSVAVCTLALAGGLGFASWVLIEKPSIEWRRRRERRAKCA